MNDSQTITHVIERLSLGARPGDRTQVERMGVSAYIRQQLNPDPSIEPASLKQRLSRLPSLFLSPAELFEQNAPPRNPSDAERSESKRRQKQVAQEAIQARILRAIESPNQLQEVMVDFWFNHFNVFIPKSMIRLWVGSYEQMAIRPHAFGKFRDLLGATAKHPAMQLYLDNWLNVAPNSRQGKKRSDQTLNENYARELLELHTLGVDGGYTQADVESLTRIFTGWDLARRNESLENNGFRFESQRHDPTDKVFLGQRIAGGGVEEGETALDILARHPSTAHHISYKLAQYFVADSPSEALVERLSNQFLSSDGDIKAVLTLLFDSDEFWSPDTYQDKFKTPYQYLFSISRAIGLASPEEVLQRLEGALNQLSMPLYHCRPPDGYAQVESAWLNADAMMRRTSFASAIYQLKEQNQPGFSELLSTLGDQFSDQTLAVLTNSSAQLQPTLILGSPEMMYR